MNILLINKLAWEMLYTMLNCIKIKEAHKLDHEAFRSMQSHSDSISAISDNCKYFYLSYIL